MTTQKRCRIRWCRQWFEANSPDLIFCDRCRQEILARERGSGAASFQNEEALRTAAFYEAQHRIADYRIIDERGDEVWASDLIKRYRAETKPRPV